LRPSRAVYFTDVSPSRVIALDPIASISPAPAAAPAAEPSRSSLPAMTAAAVETPSRSASFPWQKILIGLWITLSALVLLRLVVSLLREVVMLRRATPLHDETILQTLNRAIGHLNLRANPVVRVSGQVSSPVICCWGAHPILVVPQARPSADTPEAWFGILCHELAHWKRKDHWAFLTSELLACWLPWHPLVWWTRQRLNQLSEMACDHWVLACGQPAQVYAQSLLGLLPQRRAVCALPAVSLRTKLERRIHNIMADRPVNPRPGWKWACSSLAVAAVIAAVAAFAQSASVSEPAAGKPEESLTDYMPSGMTLRLVDKGYWSDPTSCPSPDGRYVCILNPDTTGWNVRDQITGKEHSLPSDPCGFTTSCAISPDSKYVVYEWSDFETQSAKELRLLGLDGGVPRVIYADPQSQWMSPEQWTADSMSVLAVVKTDEDTQAILVDVKAASGKPLRSFGAYWPSIAMSPDARYLAYDRPQEDDAAKCDLFLWDIHDGTEARLVTYLTDERLVGWSPDGEWILFTSDRSGTVDLWIVRTENGRCLDSPKLVQRAIGKIKPKGFLADGSFYYAVEYRNGDVYTATADFDKGELTELPSPLPYVGLKNGAEWSRDGRFVASASFDAEGPPRPKSIKIFEWETRQVTTLVPENLADHGAIRWTPDGRALLARGTAADSKRNGIYRIDVPSGKTTVLVPDVQVRLVDVTPDGKTLVYCRWRHSADKGNRALVAQAVERGEARVLYSHPRLHQQCLVISPNGQEVAFAAAEPNENAIDIKAISLEGGEPRQVYRYLGDGEITWLDWHPGGKSILFLLRGKNVQVTLWQVPAQGGSARQITKPFYGMNHLRVHPDGRRIGFSSMITLQHETWVMEHFLPK